eukprot:8103343-Pyramimonas_sp.AAC.1
MPGGGPQRLMERAGALGGIQGRFSSEKSASSRRSCSARSSGKGWSLSCAHGHCLPACVRAAVHPCAIWLPVGAGAQAASA